MCRNVFYAIIQVTWCKKQYMWQSVALYVGFWA